MLRRSQLIEQGVELWAVAGRLLSSQAFVGPARRDVVPADDDLTARDVSGSWINSNG